ncbi:hypothetical protein AB7W52_11445 [Providencia rettgeri]
MKLTEEQKADRRELAMLVQYAALAYALFGAGVAGILGALDINSLWMGVAIALVSHVLIFPGLLSERTSLKPSIGYRCGRVPLAGRS